MNIKKWIPALEWLPKYNSQMFKGDLGAGLTVGVMLIPQGMAYAMIAGLPPIYGLYASTVPLILYAIFGTSRQLAVGPVAMVSLLTATGIGAMAQGGTETYILLAITLALFVGLIQFLLGVFKLGFLVNFLSHPVISGFTSAAALIIGLSQLKHLLGVNLPRSHHVHEIVLHAIERFGEVNWVAFGIGIGGVLVIMAIKKWAKAVPAQLMAVIFGIAVVYLGGFVDQGVKIVGEIPKGLPKFSSPSFEISDWQALFPIALTIALVSFMESIAVAKAIQAKHKNYKVVSNQELIGLGIANIGGAFFQSYPTTGGFSRTAVNDQAGAKTTIASVISALFIILTLLFLTPLFYYLPNAILASVIMVAVFGLIDYKEAIHLWKSDRSDFWMLIITFIATLSLGIEQGIGVGVILSLVMVIFRTTKPHTAVLGNIPNTRIYRNINRFHEVKEREDLLIIRFDAQLYFANVNFFKERMEEEMMRKGKALKNIIIVAESMNNIDSSASHAIDELITDCKNLGIDVHFAGVKGPVRDAMAKAHLIEKIGLDNFHLSVQGAVNQIYRGEEFTNDDKAIKEEYTLQTNVHP